MLVARSLYLAAKSRRPWRLLVLPSDLCIRHKSVCCYGKSVCLGSVGWLGDLIGGRAGWSDGGQRNSVRLFLEKSPLSA